MDNTEFACYYHGSPKLLTELKAGSWVTPFMRDAMIFGVPWDSSELIDSGGSNGQPPNHLRFKDKSKIPMDHPVYVYAVVGPVKPALTNTGKEYNWNRQIILDTPVKVLHTIPSWHKCFLVE